LKRAFAVDCELIRGGGGIFDVKVDGQLIYSKFRTGTYPEPAALIKEIEALTAR
jgi:selT/selW/selH-like putative selenoprotein